MTTTTDQLAAALAALLSLNRTQGVTDTDYEAAETRADEALAAYDAERAATPREAFDVMRAAAGKGGAS